MPTRARWTVTTARATGSPILFFTQLMGLAFGMDPSALGIGTEVVSPAKALARIGLEVPSVEAAGQPSEPAAGGHEPKRQKRPQGLPMPQPLTKHEPARVAPPPPARPEAAATTESETAP